MKKLLLATLGLIFTSSLLAHSGGTDAAGCHYDRKTGVYHCH